MLKFSRGAEEEADNLGVQYLYASGYDPTAMSTMFEKLAAMNRKKPGQEYVVSTSEFQRVKARLFKTSNARAGVIGDIDDSGDGGRPTLKKRLPTADGDSTDGSSSSSSSDTKDAPPKLKKRGEEPEAKPTPTPEM
ncbi:hypothetical protein PTTG_31151 [Puccinia triticina 1-1 BBBD Race 1]|uniref:Peptidase_M48 domain-containing protein n=1 Tax=Puccinia triticina (isolate 1-1 / race 1 (BBBD)) TaxID=630390 RepID=A0A180FW17_PUCT1|nr:hypothetical protein PTTG_31151 [Puccinia triticina 1-1 BBBD Race 1]